MTVRSFLILAVLMLIAVPTFAQTNSGFTGYMIARCNFQWAHGFAFISDIGARNLAMGYLPLVINNGSNPNNRNTSIPSENASH